MPLPSDRSIIAGAGGDQAAAQSPATAPRIAVRQPALDRRGALLDAAAGRRFDLIVIGGGINGAGIAREAALRGLSVLLLERDDYGFGTTWRSTKLIHGGLRYLEHAELRLVFEGLRERGILFRTAPHLVRPLEFLVPVYRGARHGRLALRAGLTLYDLLSTGKSQPNHRAHSPAALASLEPALQQQGLLGGFTYFDGQVEFPERLCLENVLSAEAAGAAVFNHLAVTELTVARRSIEGVVARDAESGRQFEFRARVVVNAAGPWVDRVLAGHAPAGGYLGGTKGAHIVASLGEHGPTRAVYAEAGADGRPFFIVPWHGRHLIGTTDVRFNGDPASVRPEAWEVEYLCRETTSILPGVRLRPEDVHYAFAGVRPLPRTDGRREAAITRRHAIHDHHADGVSGLLSVIGGKLTSYRSLAEEAVSMVSDRLGRSLPDSGAARRPLTPGAPPPPTRPLAPFLAAIYGPRAERVLAIARLDPALGARLCPHGEDILAQAVVAVRHEGARTVGDVLLRRTPAGWNRCRGLDAAPAVAAMLGHELGWDARRRDAAIDSYRVEIERTLITCDNIQG